MDNTIDDTTDETMADERKKTRKQHAELYKVEIATYIVVWFSFFAYALWTLRRLSRDECKSRLRRGVR